MSHQVFVPVTDDIIYNHPEQIEGPLVPYFAGMECQNWLAIEINPDEVVGSGKKTQNSASEVTDILSQKKRPDLRLAYSA